MFLGHFQHNLDDKGRLMIPARFRELLDGGAFITQGFDKCLMVMNETYFTQVYERIEGMNLADPTARLLRRLILSNAYPVEVDKVGTHSCAAEPASLPANRRRGNCSRSGRIF